MRESKCKFLKGFKEQGSAQWNAEVLRSHATMLYKGMDIEYVYYFIQLGHTKSGSIEYVCRVRRRGMGVMSKK